MGFENFGNFTYLEQFIDKLRNIEIWLFIGEYLSRISWIKKEKNVRLHPKKGKKFPTTPHS